MTDHPPATEQFDVIVVGSGASGLSAALRAAVSGASVCIVEKGAYVGGTSALSGGCMWIPQNHHMHKLGIRDSREEVLTYIRAASPAEWGNVEEPLWQAFVDNAPEMLRFLEAHTPMTFAVNRNCDPYAELPGGKTMGRNLSARPFKLSRLGAWADKIRPPTIPQFLNYEEIVDGAVAANLRRAAIRFGLQGAYRKLTGRRTMGGGLVAGLLSGCLSKGCDLRLETAAKRLVVAGDRIVGLEVESKSGTTVLKAQRGVVLASGGFEWNAEMMARYQPGPVKWNGSPRTNTGDGHRMAEEVGAQLDRMDQALIMPTLPTTYEGYAEHGRPAYDVVMPHSILVNRHGRRFTNEKQMNIGLCFSEVDPGTGEPVNLPAWRVYDAQFMRKYPHMAPPAKSPVVTSAQTLEELARKVGIDPEGLVDTVARFNPAARRGEDPDFGRGSFSWDYLQGADPWHKPNRTLGTLEKPPFYAVAFNRSYLGTKGGPRTNERGQVLRQDGSRIVGLYAAGNLMANSFGTRAVGAGSTIGPCLTWGYIGGTNVVLEEAA